jgi:hypothetical protein
MNGLTHPLYSKNRKKWLSPLPLCSWGSFSHQAKLTKQLLKTDIRKLFWEVGSVTFFSWSSPINVPRHWCSSHLRVSSLNGNFVYLSVIHQTVKIRKLAAHQQTVTSWSLLNIHVKRLCVATLYIEQPSLQIRVVKLGLVPFSSLIPFLTFSRFGVLDQIFTVINKYYRGYRLSNVTNDTYTSGCGEKSIFLCCYRSFMLALRL